MIGLLMNKFVSSPSRPYIARKRDIGQVWVLQTTQLVVSWFVLGTNCRTLNYDRQKRSLPLDLKTRDIITTRSKNTIQEESAKREDSKRHKWYSAGRGRDTHGRWALKGQKEARKFTTRVADRTRVRTRVQNNIKKMVASL
jgi:hypothetical protein